MKIVKKHVGQIDGFENEGDRETISKCDYSLMIIFMFVGHAILVKLNKTNSRYRKETTHNILACLPE